MITVCIKGQTITDFSLPEIVADTIDYITAAFHFHSPEWEGLTKYAHFSNGSQPYDIELIDDVISADKHLNFTAGEWTIWLSGHLIEEGELKQRITTNQRIFSVKGTGTTDTGNPFPSAVPSVTEQIMAEIGELDELETGNKQTLVDAINEVFRTAGGEISPELITKAVEEYLKNNPIGEETDPTVPEWAKQPNKPSYTAEEVGALPNTTEIPSLEGYATEQFVKNEIANIELPEGGGSSIDAAELAKKVDVEKEINPNWEKWGDVRYNYGFDKTKQPIFNTVKGVLESDTMMSVRGGKGRWNKTDKPESGFISGGHVFEGWSGNELARITLLMGKFHETFGCLQTYSPAGLYESKRRFGWIKHGSDELNKGFDVSQGWATAYTPITLVPQAEPTEVSDYDLNPQLETADIPIGSMYYDSKADRMRVKTLSGWRSVGFKDEIADIPMSDIDIQHIVDYLVQVENRKIGKFLTGGRLAVFPIEPNSEYVVTRTYLSARFRIYLFDSETFLDAYNSQESGTLVAEDTDNNILYTLKFSNTTHKLAIVMLSNSTEARTKIAAEKVNI